MKPMMIFAFLGAMLTGFSPARADSPFDPLAPVVAEITVKADLETAWRDWTTTKGLSAFTGTVAHVDPELKPRGLYEVLFLPDAPDGGKGAEKGAILAVEPLRMISFSWKQPPYMPIGANYTFVQIFFEPVSETETRLTLHNWGWGTTPEWQAAREYFVKSWPGFLALYKKYRDSHTGD